MYAGTKANWHEVLMADSAAAANNESLPLFLCAFSADKGTEDITDLVYKDFKAMYGNNADFFKYGQPLIQAHKILAAGGRVLGKRIVAEDAKLGYLVITAKITTTEQAKKNANGQQIYLDGNGNETTDVTNDPVNETKIVIKYEAKSVTNDGKTFTEIESQVKDLLDETNMVYPIFVICDNGRGVTNKAVRIAPNYDLSKTMTFMLYSIQDIEDTSTIESKSFSLYPDGISYTSGVKKNMSLALHTTTQFMTEYYSDGLTKFMDKLASLTSYTVEELYGLDILFGKTLKGEAISTFSIDPEGLTLNATYGNKLQKGSNGTFGDAPFPGTTASDAWTAKAIEFFGGSFSDEIYDLDQHKIDFCVDANYPDTVKAKIVELANFREDFYYFRDLGLSINTVNGALTKVSSLDWEKSPFVGDYMTTYDIIDEYSRKQIKVTMLHGLAPLLVPHYATNIAAPIAGEFNNFSITEAVDGTINVIPRITPLTDQKSDLDDAHVNYANYSSNGALVIQSTYTSQDHWGPLSYASNVIVTQMCIKDIRRYCPKIRFMLMEGNDFTKYKQLIENNVIASYKQYFKDITLIYTRDDEYIASKIFNASLYCYYRDFPQGEIFDVFAVEGSPDTNPVY